MKVLQFPPGHNLAHEVKQQCDELEELHENLAKAYRLCDILEGRIHEAEQSFNDVLNRYSKAIGIENVPIRYFEYATESIEVDIDSGEIIFTPWSDEDDEETT